MSSLGISGMMEKEGVKREMASIRQVRYHIRPIRMGDRSSLQMQTAFLFRGIHPAAGPIIAGNRAMRAADG